MGITALYATASDQILFRVRLQKGKSYGLRMTTDQVISQEIEGQRINIKQTISINKLLYLAFLYKIRIPRRA